MATKIETKPELKVVAETKPVEIDPKQVLVNDAGQAWRTVLVRMPEGSTQDDLRNPKIWKRVQSNRQTGLIKMDHLLVLAFDESWSARAVVTHATSEVAHLAIERVASFKEQGQSLFNDGTLEVYWDGGAYGVRRVSDHVRVLTEGFLTEAQAATALRGWYPKKVG